MRQNSIYKIPAAFTPDCSSEEIRKGAIELLLSQAGYQKMLQKKSPINDCYECYFSFLGIDIDTCERSKLEKTIFKDNEARLTQETIEKILDRFPEFFNNRKVKVFDHDVGYITIANNKSKSPEVK